MGGITSNLAMYELTSRLPDVICGQKVRSYLVAETLGGNDGNLIAYSLVGLEVESQLGVVSLDDDLGGLLDSLGTNATHDCGCW